MKTTHSAEYLTQLSNKHSFLRDLLSPYLHTSSDIEMFASPETHYRMRAEFRVWHQGDDSYFIMFDQTTKEQYRVDTLPAASTIINQLMVDVMNVVRKTPELRTKIFQIDFLTTTTGEALISMLYHRVLGDDWIRTINSLKQTLSTDYKIDFIGRAKKLKLVVDRDFVIERLTAKGTTYSFQQIENSFTQPNAFINEKMVNWAIDTLGNCPNDLLELYCGAGNFSIPLSSIFRKVLATEISKTSVNAAQYNIQENKIHNVDIIRLSSEEFVQAINGEREFRRLAHINLADYSFSTVLVDPPRSGLDNATRKLISRFEYILYISCNPQTLAHDLSCLALTHKLVKVALFDQFPFTEHIETGVFLQKITSD